MNKKITKKEFYKWVDEMYTRYSNDSFVSMIRKDDYIFVFRISDMKKVGMSKCHPEDNYNYAIGAAIAYARCIGEEVPKVYEISCCAVFRLSYGTHFLYNGQRYVYLGRNPVLPNRSAVCYAIETDEYVEFEDSLTIVDVIKED